MRNLLFIFVFSASLLKGQDVIYFKDGKAQEGILVSVGNEFVFFKNHDTSLIRKIPRSEIIMAESSRGVRYLISAKQTSESTRRKTTTDKNTRLIGLQPMGLVVGRATVVYEKLFAEQKFGLVIPFSLTFNPYGVDEDSSGIGSFSRAGGINVIAGLDLNYYFGKGERSKFFIGPRLRYGTDVFLGYTEGFTLQSQVGYRFSLTQKIQQHLSFGYGFIKVISIPGGNVFFNDNYFSWFSLNYRISFCW